MFMKKRCDYGNLEVKNGAISEKADAGKEEAAMLRKTNRVFVSALL